MSPGESFADRLADPADGAVGREHELRVRRLRQPRRALLDFARQRFLRGAREHLGFGAASGSIGRKAKAFEPANRMAFDNNVACLADFCFEHRVFF